MNKIVVGFGSHEHSTSALEWSACIAKRTKQKVIVLNVLHPSFSEFSPDLYYQLLTDQQAHIERIMKRRGHANFQVVVHDGEPAHELERYAMLSHAALIVVGHRGSSAPGGFGEHGAAEHLLRTSTVPFVVVRPDTALPPHDHDFTIVVGVDGSEANADSVTAIAQLAESLYAHTIPVMAVKPGSSTGRGAFNRHGALMVDQDDAEAIVSKLPNNEPIETPNCGPVDGLLLVADERNADLIAVGTRGHLGLSDLFAGQIGRHLITRSHRPVMIAPHH